MEAYERKKDEWNGENPVCSCRCRHRRSIVVSVAIYKSTHTRPERGSIDDGASRGFSPCMIFSSREKREWGEKKIQFRSYY